MRILKHVVITTVMLLWSMMIFSQQLRLGKNPYNLQKSAILELESDNQGLLFPRIADTALINSMMPPDGMVVFFQPLKQLIVRTNGAWKPLISGVHSLSALSDASITSPGNGQLLQYNGTKWVNTTPAYLTAIDTINIPGFYLKVRSLLSAGTGISYNNNTGVISNAGVVSLNGNTGALTMDTGYINNFYLKSRSLLSAGTGISYNSSTGLISSSINTALFWTAGGNAMASMQSIGTTSNFSLPFITNNTEKMRLTATGYLGIGTTGPTSMLHVKSGVTDQSGVRMENLTSASATTSGAATLGVDANGNVVRAKAPVYYSGGIGGSATVDGITKIWVAEVANVATGIQTVTIPANIGFTSISGITLTAKGGSDATNSPVAIITSNTTSAISIRVLESKLTSIVLGGNAEGLEPHTNTSTTIYIRVEGN